MGALLDKYDSARHEPIRCKLEIVEKIILRLSKIAELHRLCWTEIILLGTSQSNASLIVSRAGLCKPGALLGEEHTHCHEPTYHLRFYTTTDIARCIEAGPVDSG